jgi:F-type H+/Na+-transporting ATPase subunit beta
MATGTVRQVIGPTVDFEFPPDALPSIYNAVTIDDDERDIHLVCEVLLHRGNNLVRSVAMSSTDGVVRGMEAIDTKIGRAHV